MRHDAITASSAVESALAWHETPEAQALIADCAANPPKLKRTPAALADFFAGGPEFVMRYDRNDERVDDLSRMSNAAFLAAEAAGADMCDLVLSWPSLDGLINAAVEVAS